MNFDVIHWISRVAQEYIEGRLGVYKGVAQEYIKDKSGVAQEYIGIILRITPRVHRESP